MGTLRREVHEAGAAEEIRNHGLVLFESHRLGAFEPHDRQIRRVLIHSRQILEFFVVQGRRPSVYTTLHKLLLDGPLLPSQIRGLAAQ